MNYKTFKTMLQITFFGGFHNSGEITINVKNEKARERIINGESHPLDELSNNQRRKLNRFFCGIKGCTCGGAVRAEYYYRVDRKKNLPF